MAGLVAAGGADVFAHGLHVAMVALGLTGLAAIILPRQLERFRAGVAEPRDAHESRVLALRAQLAAGVPPAPSAQSSPPGVSAEPCDPLPSSRGLGSLDPVTTRLLPLMVVSGIGSAGAHAAVAPPHLRDGLLFGGFFLLCAAAQLAWTMAMLGGTTPAVLRWGILGNLAVVLLWATTRLWGLPWGLMPEPEAFGPWDATCAAWEITIVLGSIRLLREPRTGLRPAAPCDWSAAATTWLGASTVLLVLLPFLGAHS